MIHRCKKNRLPKKNKRTQDLKVNGMWKSKLGEGSSRPLCCDYFYPTYSIILFYPYIGVQCLAFNWVMCIKTWGAFFWLIKTTADGGWMATKKTVYHRETFLLHYLYNEKKGGVILLYIIRMGFIVQNLESCSSYARTYWVKFGSSVETKKTRPRSTALYDSLEYS